MEPLLLGISGTLGSGKDTAFGFIEEWAEGRDLTAVRRAFADPLKSSAGRALGLAGPDEDVIAAMNKLKVEGTVHSYWDDTPGKEVGCKISGREYLQLY